MTARVGAFLAAFLLGAIPVFAQTDPAFESAAQEQAVEESSVDLIADEDTEPKAAGSAQEEPAEKAPEATGAGPSEKTEEKESDIAPPEEAAEAPAENDTATTVEEENVAESQGAAEESTAEDFVVDEESSDIIIEVEEDILILEDGEEEDIFAVEEKVAPVEGLPEETAKTKSKEKKSEAKKGPEEYERYIDRRYEEYDEYYEGRRDPGVDTADTAKKKAIVVAPSDAQVEEARSINFAKNLEEYRSPKTALFMSLLLPGLGQAYAKNYWKSAVFGAAEIAAVALSVRYAVVAADKKEDARAFADANYDTDEFWKYYNNMRTYLAPYRDEDRLDDVMRDILWDTTGFRSDVQEKNNGYYSTIGEKTMVQGWKDCEPRLGTDGFNLDSTYTYTYEEVKNPDEATTGNPDTIWLLNQISASGDTVKGIYGYSLNRQKYRTMVSEYNHDYRISSNLLFVLLANHLVSAVDALITAKAHNERLLGKQSMWQRIHLDQQLAVTEHGLQSSFGVRFRF